MGESERKKTARIRNNCGAITNNCCQRAPEPTHIVFRQIPPHMSILLILLQTVNNRSKTLGAMLGFYSWIARFVESTSGTSLLPDDPAGRTHGGPKHENQTGGVVGSVVSLQNA